ncbi:hypothetical protein BASA81_000389 [Batrachochytrium salamandrivorans]|nr:hypothetical protein BASA81_000389 [Batrachochytrium salamandrivorans]
MKRASALVKPQPQTKPWHLLGGAVLLLGGSALVFNRRPLSGSALMCTGAFVSMTSANAIRMAPWLVWGSIGSFLLAGYWLDFEAKQIQNVVALAQAPMRVLRPGVEFEDCLPMPYFHCLTRPKYSQSHFGLGIAVLVVGVERDARTDRLEYVTASVTAKRRLPWSEFVIDSITLL